MNESDLTRQIFDSITSRTAHGRYVLSEDLSHGCVFGHVGMGETMGRRLNEEELKAIRWLFAEGHCTLGKRVDFVSSDLEAKGIDPISGIPFHQDLHVLGRVLEPASPDAGAERTLFC